MDDTKRNQLVLITIIVLLLSFVIGFTIYSVLNNKKDNNEFSVKFKQIYSSDYDLRILNDDYYIGLYDGKINVFIDNDGKEVYRTNVEIPFTDYFNLDKTKSLIVNSEEEVITLNLFDGEKVELYDVISDIKYAKPLLDENYNILAFVEIKESGFDFYDVANKEVRHIKDYIFVSDGKSSKNDYYFANNNNYIVVKKGDNYGVIDFYGKEVIPCKYKNIKGIGNDLYIAQDKKGNYGLISSDKELINFNYKVIYYSKGYYLLVDKNNKMALYDSELNDLTGFKMDYDSLIEYNLRSDINSIRLEVVDDNVYIINNNLEDVNKTEYEEHTMYLFTGVLNKFEEHGVYIDNDIYLYDNDYNLVIYDKNMNELGRFKLNASKIFDISKINDYIFEITYDYEDGLKTTKYYDYSGKELEYDYGKTMIKGKDYIGCISANNKVLSIVYKDEVIEELKEEDIRMNGNIIVTKNSLYVLETS